MSSPRVVAIDGPSGSGKSTVARAVGAALGLAVLDTGAMYRAVALATLEARVASDDGDACAEIARASVIELEHGATMLDGRDVSAEIRGPEVTAAVSEVSAHPPVRKVLVARQREWVERHGGGVVEGRDIGTVVFPDALVKVFLTASDDERARRRQRDEADAARDVEFADVKAALERRDQSDRRRQTSPLRAADDAIEVDTTAADVDEVAADIVVRFRAAEARLMLFYTVVRWIVAGGSCLAYRVRMRGKENLPRTGGYILAPSHRSMMDIPFVAWLTPKRLRYMGKRSLFDKPMLGAVFTKLGGFPVERDGTDRKALRDSIAMLQSGEILLVFPEGTRHAGPKIEPLQPGAAYLAFAAGVPIVPIGVAGSEEILRTRKSHIPRFGRVTIVVGEPLMVPPRDGGVVPRAEVDAITAELHEAVQQAFDEANVLHDG